MIRYLIRLKQPSGPIIMLLSNNLVPMILVPLFKDFISPTLKKACLLIVQIYKVHLWKTNNYTCFITHQQKNGSIYQFINLSSSFFQTHVMHSLQPATCPLHLYSVHLSDLKTGTN